VPEAIKADLEAKTGALIETTLKSKFVKPPPKDRRWKYIIDVGTKGFRSYFYFFSTYACPGPNALSPTFESKFARMECVGDGRFNLSFVRHTGQWLELFRGLTLDECLASIQNDPWSQAG
jgi:hypothetical protein